MGLFRAFWDPTSLDKVSCICEKLTFRVRQNYLEHFKVDDPLSGSYYCGEETKLSSAIDCLENLWDDFYIVVKSEYLTLFDGKTLESEQQ